MAQRTFKVSLPKLISKESTNILRVHIKKNQKQQNKNTTKILVINSAKLQHHTLATCTKSFIYTNRIIPSFFLIYFESVSSAKIHRKQWVDIYLLVLNLSLENKGTHKTNQTKKPRHNNNKKTTKHQPNHTNYQNSKFPKTPSRCYWLKYWKLHV